MMQGPWRAVWVAAFLAAAAAFSGIAGRAQQLPSDGAVRITQQDFKKLIASKNVAIVDTRNLDVYRMGHIPGAVLLPVEGLATWPPEYAKVVDQLKASNRPVVTYCA
jgi:predicted sulfurtransferase